ncbi:MAG: prepilin-type N-terminal cleavage/methylation domain-containing protein [Bacteriovoracia bacterium]
MRNQQSGFTLLEFMIAFALLTVILSAVFITQGTSLSSSVRSKNILIATNLARNIINENEVKYEGVSFEQLPKEESGTFPEPNQQFKWTAKYEEVEFDTLAEMMAKKNEKDGTADATTAQVVKLFLDYLKKSVRRVTLTVEWPDGNGTSSQTFSELLVNYDAEFSTGL